MDGKDTGFFTYDLKYVPLCVQPPDNQLNDFKKVMNTAIIEYLRESRQSGLKHAHEILSSGLSVGEAGVQYHRQHGKTSLPAEKFDVYSTIVHCLDDHLPTSVQPEVIQKYVSFVNFQKKDYKRKLRQGIKRFLHDTHVAKDKHMKIIQAVLQDVEKL